MNINFSDFANKPFAIAVSGGVDSMALLHMMAHLHPVVLHVNHNLRAGAGAEAEYVADTAKNLGLEYKVFNIDKLPKSNLEAAARTARYKLMTDYCRENGIEYLAVAHQADDQIETFLMNLRRGSGIWGLAAMRGESVRDGVKIVRPLLNVFRNELCEYCDSHGIKYFCDEMNEDEKYTRVKIRKNRHLLGISDDKILLAIKNLNRTRDALDELVTDHWSLVAENGTAIFDESFLFDAPHDIRLKLLGTWIKNVGGHDYQPRLNSLENALDKLSGDCKITLGGCVLRRLGDEILIVPEGESASFIKRRKNEKTKRN